MLQRTLQAVRSILTADPSVNPPERNRLLSHMRQGPEAQTNPTIVSRVGSKPASAGHFKTSQLSCANEYHFWSFLQARSFIR